jgi:hypothetical protein
VVLDDDWEVLDVELPSRWALLLYTDGLVEGRPHEEPTAPEPAAHGDGVLDTEGLLTVLDECAVAEREENPVTAPETTDGPAPLPWYVDPDRLLDVVLRRVRDLTEERADDVAAVLLVAGR